MEDYSALKTNEQSSHEKAWSALKCILLDERNQCEKAKNCDSNSMTFCKRQNSKDNENISGCQVLERRDG